MKTIRIYHFKEKHQMRITFVKLLKEYNPEFGLKMAKQSMDKMLDGIPIVFEIEDRLLNEFTKELDVLNLEYSIT